jgi:folate-dependent phosphoribosylglycinamide formyltransferase PurN
MGDDPLNVRFGEDWQRLTKDLLFDSEGSLKFKPDLWRDIRQVIMPTLIDNVGYVPIPRVEYTDDSIDLVVENLTLSGRNLFPNYISAEAHNFMKFSPYNAIADQGHHEFTLTFGQIQADMRDVAFYFRKKTGIPKLTDSGLADVVLGGEGMTATVHLVSADKDRSSVFKVKNVVVKVDSLKFSIRDSKHDLLYKTLRPLATGLIKKQIQKAVADAIRTGMEYVDGQLVGVRDRMAEAKANDSQSRTQALQELFQRKKDEASAKSTNSTSQFKVVSNKRDSIVQAGHPTGWVNRTTEKADAAMTGEAWHSPAFNIV